MLTWKKTICTFLLLTGALYAVVSAQDSGPGAGEGPVITPAPGVETIEAPTPNTDGFIRDTGMPEPAPADDGTPSMLQKQRHLDARNIETPNDGGVSNATEATVGLVKRTASNFWALLKSSWKDMAIFFLWLLIWAIVGGIIGAAVGGLVAILVFMKLNQAKLFDLDFDWYRYVKWVWCVIFIGFFFFGGGYAGVYIGAGLECRNAIIERKVIDKVLASIYCAVALDPDKFQLDGSEDVARIQKMLNESPKQAQNIQVDIGQALKDMSEEDVAQTTLAPWQIKTIKWLTGKDAGKFVLENVEKATDPRVVVLLFYAAAKDSEQYGELLKKYPNSDYIAAGISYSMDKARKQAVRSLGKLVAEQVSIGLYLGCVPPLLLAVTFYLCRLLCNFIMVWWEQRQLKLNA